MYVFIKCWYFLWNILLFHPRGMTKKMITIAAKRLELIKNYIFLRQWNHIIFR